MNTVHSLGAINKDTGEYVYPKIANKKDEYSCPDCGKDLILCQGEIRIHHFRHKVDTINPCNYYNNPGESQLHKDAKLLIKTLIDKKTPISFIRNCITCKKNDEFEIPETSETSIIKNEYRFDYNGLKIADVAYLDNDEIVCIFEICKTNKTSDENRPEPWFEIKALTLINMANETSLSSLQIPCIRCEKCDKCKENEIITYFQNQQKIKNNKIRIIKDQLENIGTNRNNEDYSDDNSGDHRYMRHSKQDQNYKKSLTNELLMINNDIEYIVVNNVITIEHPKTKTKIRRSLVSDKTFHKGKWFEKIFINSICKWYHSENDDILNYLTS
jgi:hypothetical protein